MTYEHPGFISFIKSPRTSSYLDDHRYWSHHAAVAINYIDFHLSLGSVTALS